MDFIDYHNKTVFSVYNLRSEILMRLLMQVVANEHFSLRVFLIVRRISILKLMGKQIKMSLKYKQLVLS